jgi:hypothetical protein
MLDEVNEIAREEMMMTTTTFGERELLYLSLMSGK